MKVSEALNNEPGTIMIEASRVGVAGLAVALLSGSLVALSGCDISSEPLAALVRITEPDRGDTIRVGQPFVLQARIETDGPADSLVVFLHPRASGYQPIRQHVLPVPADLKAGTGVLHAEIDTTLVLDALPVPDVHAYTISLTAFVNGRASGGIGGTEIVVE